MLWTFSEKLRVLVQDLLQLLWRLTVLVHLRVGPKQFYERAIDRLPLKSNFSLPVSSEERFGPVAYDY